MSSLEIINYNRIAEAINYIKQNFKQQANLDEVAEKIHLSPFHFQRLFTEWGGVSPKKLLQYRVIQSTGNFGGYMWGATRKTAIIGWEAAKTNSEN